MTRFGPWRKAAAQRSRLGEAPLRAAGGSSGGSKVLLKSSTLIIDLAGAVIAARNSRDRGSMVRKALTGHRYGKQTYNWSQCLNRLEVKATGDCRHVQSQIASV